MKIKIYLVFLSLYIPAFSFAQYQLRGTIVDSTSHRPLIGASVILKGYKTGTQTGFDGTFILNILQSQGVIMVSYLGYKTDEFAFNNLENHRYSLVVDSKTLNDVIVSTGYQQLPAERATGSFVNIDNNLLNRRVSPDVMSRLEDVTSGLIFNRNVAGRVNDISIRGQSTLFSNAQPLIVLDNFPYDGDLNNINPNDIENVTILKDAAAASIWGTRAGNGVIVITTKKGSYNKPIKVSFNTNVTIGDKPNLFYQSKMSTSDFVDVEKLLFSRGFYASSENSASHAPLTPVVELLIAARDGKISSADANAQIDALRSIDVRNDFNKYFYRKSVNQQYAFNLNGGSANQQYYVAAGYDKDLSNLVRNGFDKLNVNANNTYSFLNHKLALTTGFYLTQSNTSQNNQGIGSVYMTPTAGLYPYARIADPSGNPLSIVKDYRSSFVQSAGQQGLLNWQYYPLTELDLADNTTKITDYRLNAMVNYKIIPQLSVDALYLYERGINDTRNYQAANSYYTRNLINSYTQVNTDRSLSYPVPVGAIVDLTNQSYYTNDFRSQLNYDQSFGQKHSLNAIAGYEIRTLHTLGNTYRLYGYDNEHAISSPVDYITPYTQYYYPGYTVQVPYADSGIDQIDHNLSYYANAAYAYNRRYTVSASARFDQSNLFGVRANQKGVPLWSAGFGWELSDESFYKINWLPYIKLRATYGVSGNVNKSVSAYTTAYYYNAAYSPINQPYAQIVNPPDPDLSWERIKTLNLGLDFRVVNNRITGTIEYYQKNGIDLIGNSLSAPSTGVLTFTGNNASTKGRGVDLMLNSYNLNGAFTWQTNLLFSHVTSIVTAYSTMSPITSYLQFGYGAGAYPLLGKPLYSIYSYRWAGLDPLNGNPRGYLNGVVSSDYASIIKAATTQNIVYNGPAQPTFFGALRNTFGWKNISVSANISYRFGYYFRKASIRYATVLRGQGGTGDYSLRWQKPGDENSTNVPSLPASINLNRDNLYTYSSVLVDKGDNIRLQDISVSYDLIKAKMKALPFSHVKLYLYANNIALLWKANKFGIDPDYQTGPPPKTIAVGLKADF